MMPYPVFSSSAPVGIVQLVQHMKSPGKLLLGLLLSVF
jgi:hypothetical protein